MTNLKLFSLFFLPLFLLLGCLMGLNVQAQTNAEAIEVELLKLKQSDILESDYKTVTDIQDDKLVNEQKIIYTYIGEEVDNAQNIIFKNNSNTSDTEKLNNNTFKIYNKPKFYKSDNNFVYELETGLTTPEIWSKANVQTLEEKIISLLVTPYAIASQYYSQSPDGCILRNAPSGESWSTIRTSSGTGIYPSDTYNGLNYIAYGTTGWTFNTRSMLFFDTSSIGADYEVSSSSVYIMGRDKADTLGAEPDLNVYALSPTGNVLVMGDYLNCGTTAFSDPITYSNWSTTGYNQWLLNTAGKEAINTTGTTTFCLLNSKDASGVEPSHTNENSAYVRGYLSEEGGSGSDPYLLVEVQEISTSTPPTESTSTSPIYAVCVPPTNNDLSLITGCAVTETYSSTTGTSTVTTNYVYHIPFLVWLILASVTLFIASRIIIELIIRWRA